MVSSVLKIIIDPRCHINYSSYYIEGLRALFGSSKISFACLSEISGKIDFGMAVKVVTADGERRLFFDNHDGDKVNEVMYDWADAYGKINLSLDDAHREKAVPVGPGFGLNLWNPLSTIVRGLRNYRIIKRHCGDSFPYSMKSFIQEYAYMFIRRKSYSYYHRFTREEDKDYFFSMSTLWWGGLSFKTTNRYRGDFMRLCMQHMPQFEGGFFYNERVGRESKTYSGYLEEYHDMIYRKRLSMTQYDKRNRRSWFVFNTPSVIGCHGWKLGEYLCEGKAIVSTPLNNVMPGNFQDGVHYLEVSTPQQMEQAIIRLRDDAQLVASLKRNAFDYFNQWVSPEAAVKAVLAKAGIVIS